MGRKEYPSVSSPGYSWTGAARIESDEWVAPAWVCWAYRVLQVAAVLVFVEDAILTWQVLVKWGLVR